MSESDRAGMRSTPTDWSASGPVASHDVEARSPAEAQLVRDPHPFRDLLTVARVLDPHEGELLKLAMAAVATHSPTDALILQGLINELKATSDLLDRQRPLRRPTALGCEARDESTLIDHLCTLDGLSGDLALPLKATLSRTHLLTKISFLRAVVKATSVLRDSAVSARMAHALREKLAQSIYTLLAEELFLAVLRMPDVSRRIKRGAADQLITVWDDAALEIDDFAPLLESAWYARNRINSANSTLLGAAETFRLVTEDCSPEVLEFFGREEMSRDESAAFEEFLFNMTSEELATLRRAMVEQQVSAATPAWAAEVLGRQIDEVQHAREIDPIALYRSYQRRQLAADFRLKTNTPGPHRTAEGYLMCYLLDQAVGPTDPDRESFFSKRRGVAEAPRSMDPPSAQRLGPVSAPALMGGGFATGASERADGSTEARRDVADDGPVTPRP
ncbi:MAG TPA: hypothetical protein VF469_01975 [Kofleriaceae bacterium]